MDKTCRRVLLALGLLWIAPSFADAGYVMDTSGEYSYQLQPGWREDASVTGKLITGGCEVTLSDLTITGTDDNGALTVRNATLHSVLNANVVIASSSDASLTVDAGGKVYLNTGTAYFNVASNGNNATITINEGGLLQVQTNYFGNHNAAGATQKVYLNVLGGTLYNSSSNQELRLGWHNPMDIVVSKGGVVQSAVGINLAADGSKAKSNATNLTIRGDSSVIASGAGISFGSKEYGPSVIEFMADNSGMGKINTTAFKQLTYGTVKLGTDHALAAMTANSYQAITTTSGSSSFSGWTDLNDATALWHGVRDGNVVNAYLNPALKQGGADYKLAINDSINRVDIGEGMRSAGWVTLDPSDSIFQLTLKTSGLDSETATQAFADWYNLSDNTTSAYARGENLLSIAAFTPDRTVFAWDFSEYKGVNGVQLMALSGNNVPEPTAWLLMVMGVWFLKKNFDTRCRRHKT